MTHALGVLLLCAKAAPRRAVQDLLDQAPGALHLTSLENLDQAAGLGGRHAPDAVIMVFASLGPDAFSEIARAHAAFPHGPILVMSPDPALPASLEALSAGAQDCMDLENCGPAGLWHTLQLALARSARIKEEWQRERRYESIVEQQSELIARFRPEGTITFANQALAGYLGISPDEMRGKSFRDLLKGGRGRGLFGDLLALDHGQPQTQIEAPMQGGDGRDRWLRWIIRAIFGEQGELFEYQAVGVDITTRKEVEKALQSAEANLRQLIFNNADGLVVTDLEGRILFVNPAGQSLLGTSAWDAMRDGFPFELSGGDRREISLTRSDGQEVVAEMRVAVTKWQNQPAYLASLRDISELVRLRERLRSTSLTDDLTGIYNRRGFMTLARQQLKTAQRMQRSLIMFFMDMDHLKAINDTHGHPQGDRAIHETSIVLKTTFRESDILARVGGDEFAALALTLEGEDADSMSRRLRDNLDSWNESASRPYQLSLSVGYAVCEPGFPRTVEDLLAQADRRMYERKRARHARESGKVRVLRPDKDTKGNAT